VADTADLAELKKDDAAADTLTIAEAKKRLAAALGVAPEAIEITIRA
jgi:hypothetical protein